MVFQVLHALLEYTAPSTLAAGVVLLALFVALLLPSAQDRAVACLPRPSSTLPVLGNTLDAMFAQRMRLHDWFTDNCKLFKETPWVFKVVGQSPMVVIITEALWEDVLKTQFEVFPRGAEFRDALRDVFGDGILNSDGANWYHQRKKTSLLFTPKMMRDVMEVTVTRHTERLCEIVRDSNGAPLDMKHLFELFATDVFTKIGFGVDLKFLEQGNEEFFERFRRIGNILMHRNEQPAWLWKTMQALGLGVEAQQTDDVAYADKFIHKIIDDAIAANAAKKVSSDAADSDKTRTSTDLIDLFVNVSDESDASTPATPDPKAIRDMVMSFITGGRDTTAYGMSWFIVQMAKYPAIQAKIRTEIFDKLPELAAAANDASIVPTKDQTNVLTYLEAAIKETLRLHPVVPLNVKIASEDVTLIDGTFLKAGTKVLMPIYAMARMKSIWGPDAEEFNPDRWIDATTGELRTFSPFKFSAFSGGPRICPGRHFSLMEMKLTLSALLSKFEFSTEGDASAIAYDKSLVLSIAGPVMVRATPVTK